MTKPETTPEELLASLIVKCLEKSRVTKKWMHGRFKEIKQVSTTEKGDIAEEFAIELASSHGLDAMPNISKRGEWDIKISGKKVEVKMASEDVHGNFQFNGIRYDTKFDILLVIGISPDGIFFETYKRRELIDMPLVAMAKKTNAAYKLTRRIDQLLSISDFHKSFGNPGM